MQSLPNLYCRPFDSAQGPVIKNNSKEWKREEVCLVHTSSLQLLPKKIISAPVPERSRRAGELEL